jgi:hypothetical protein
MLERSDIKIAICDRLVQLNGEMKPYQARTGLSIQRMKWLLRHQAVAAKAKFCVDCKILSSFKNAGNLWPHIQVYPFDHL